jgi:hypothetical protein
MIVPYCIHFVRVDLSMQYIFGAKFAKINSNFTPHITPQSMLMHS